MSRKLFFPSAAGLAVVLSACAPLEPIERAPTQLASPRSGVVLMSLQEVITRYAPADFKIAPDADVDYSAQVKFDTSAPWDVAFKAALSSVGMDALQQTARVEPSPPVPAHPRAKPPVAENSLVPITDRPVDARATATVAPVDARANLAPAITPCTTGAGPTVVGEQGRTWDARPHSSLKQTVERWAAVEGWEVSWKLKDEQTAELVDLTLGGGTRCQGTFREAITALFNALPSNVKVQADLWGENTPPMVHVSNGVEGL